MNEKVFKGDHEEAPLTPEQAAVQKRIKQKSDKHERITKELNSLSQRYPEAYKFLKEYIEYEIYTMDYIISNANDSDVILKYSGALRQMVEMREKLDVYVDFT
jgi:vacuolar-type H+-ATPase subunit I/STV1